jgi:hypothetical protein
MKNQNREENSTDIDEILKRISGGSDKPPYRRVVEYYFSVDGKDLKVRHRGRDSVRVRWSGWDFEVGGGLVKNANGAFVWFQGEHHFIRHGSQVFADAIAHYLSNNPLPQDK